MLLAARPMSQAIPSGVCALRRRLPFPLVLGLLFLWVALDAAPASAIPVTFRYKAPAASTVVLRGSFNSWSVSADPMTGPDAEGYWSTVKDLAAGDHEYKFFVNGTTWLADPENARTTGGTGNSLLTVATPMIYYAKPVAGAVFPPGTPVAIDAFITWDASTALIAAPIALSIDGAPPLANALDSFNATTGRFTWTPPVPFVDGEHSFTLSVQTVDGKSASISGTFTLRSAVSEVYFDQFDHGLVEGNPGDLNTDFWAGAKYNITYLPNLDMPTADGALRMANGGGEGAQCASKSLDLELPTNNYEIYASVRFTNFAVGQDEQNVEFIPRFDGTNGYLLTLDAGLSLIRLRRYGGGYTDLIPPVAHTINPGEMRFVYFKVEGTNPVVLTARVATNRTFSAASIVYDQTWSETSWLQTGTGVGLNCWSATTAFSFDFDYFAIGDIGFPHPDSAWDRPWYTGAPAEPPPDTTGDLTSYEVTPSQVLLHSGSSTIVVTPRLDRTARVDYYATAETSLTLTAFPSWSVTRTSWPTLPITVTDGDPVRIAAGDMRIDVERSPLRLQFRKADGTLMLEQAPSVAMAATGAARSVSFALEADDAIYGLGETSVNSGIGINRRGSSLTIRNQHEPPSYLVMPTWVSRRNYGVMIDNPAVATLSFGASVSDRIDYTSQEGELSFYVSIGDSMYDVIDQQTQVTGRPVLAPRWSFGNLQSKYGYTSFAEIQSIIDGFTSRQIPLDAVVMDLDWFGKETMGNLEFQSTSNWANPVAAMAGLRAQGYRFIPITEPQITGQSFNAAEALAQGLVGTRSDGTTAYQVGSLSWITTQSSVYILDFTKAATRTWWKQKHRKLLQDYRFDGIWQDLTEPEGQPSDMRYEGGSAAKARNTIGLNMARSIDEAFAEYRPGERTMIMSRSGALGMQKYGVSVWSGDVACSFQALEYQVVLAQSMGLAGVPYWNSDIGGYSGTPSSELYLRWCQFGLFNPVYRPHGGGSNREPWRFGTTTQNQVADVLRLRYRLIPHYYTVARESYDTGAPIMRPLVMDWPGDSQVAGLNSQFMYGPNLLARPVTAQGSTSVNVYLPAGDWADWFTRATSTGPTTKSVATSNGAYPLFVRCPTILPLGPVMMRSDASPLSRVTLRVFFGASANAASGTLYEDDGLTTAYASGGFATTSYTATRSGTGANEVVDARVSAASGSFTGMLTERVYVWEFPMTAAPAHVWYDGDELLRLADSTSEPAAEGWSWDATQSVVRVATPWASLATSHRVYAGATAPEPTGTTSGWMLK